MTTQDEEVARGIAELCCREHGLSGMGGLSLQGMITAALSTARTTAIKAERQQWQAAIAPNYCSSSDPVDIIEMHDDAIKQRERERIRGAINVRYKNDSLSITYQAGYNAALDDLLKVIEGGE